VPFEIGTTQVRDLATATLKAFYYQRTAIPLEARYAGRWARAAGHPDTVVLVHPSAASPSRPAGTRISSPLGWYDAGDYNKYVVNSGITTYTLLLVAEQYPRYAAKLRTNIPESANALPDVLDEALFNVRWMLTMQDPADGGVYHKLTNAVFDPFIEPRAATAPRYVVQKSTAAALDFAAVMAQASRIASRYPRELPRLSDSLRTAALAAWRWARQHPDSLYDQSRLNATTTPQIQTGTYGDRRVRDEFRWAAAELYLATGQDSFLVAAPPLGADSVDVPSWGSVGTLALVSLAEHRRELPSSVDATPITDRLVGLARRLRAVADTTAYGVAMGSRSDFVWGSNAVAANQGLVLVQAYRLTRDTSFLRAAAANLDYLLGRNPTGYSFVTGVPAPSAVGRGHGRGAGTRAARRRAESVAAGSMQRLSVVASRTFLSRRAVQLRVERDRDQLERAARVSVRRDRCGVHGTPHAHPLIVHPCRVASALRADQPGNEDARSGRGLRLRVTVRALDERSMHSGAPTRNIPTSS
jgi:endoglucanase